MPPFKITIEEISTTKYTDTESVLAEERHYTDKERGEEHRWMAESSKDAYTKKIYNEVAVDKYRTETTKVFEQTVETLALKHVIKAINE